MAFSPENNPYMPGDPYSYDLKWVVDEINSWKSTKEAADQAVSIAQGSADNAYTSANKAEAWAIGYYEGEPVEPGEPQYENNAKYYAEQAGNSANSAADDAADAHADMLTAKNYADNIADPVSGIVTDWLTDHISNPSSPPLDTSLSIPGSAADAGAVGDVLSMIIENINHSPNILDQQNANIVTGKYLNYNTGAEGTNPDYMYDADYIPVNANTQYYISLWNQDGTFAGAFNYFTLYYDSDKVFISGTQGATSPFTTPVNCAYIRISTTTAGWSLRNYMIEQGSDHSAHFIPYYVNAVLKSPVAIVDINGAGKYTSINDAVQTEPEGTPILVLPGVYEENVQAWNKKVIIIGYDRESCILKDASGDYPTPPLEIDHGCIQNMSIIEKANGAGTNPLGAYAIHVEGHGLYNESLLIKNCYIYSDSSSAIGMGLRGGCSVRIEDCEIICAGARVSTGAAPLYFHDADAAGYRGTANLYLKNNVFRNTSMTLYSMLTINSIHSDNTTYLHFMYNIFVRANNAAPIKYNTWNTAGNDAADGWNGLSCMYLTEDSFGNNQSDMNY